MEGRKAPLQIGDQVCGIFQSDVQTEQRAAIGSENGSGFQLRITGNGKTFEAAPGETQTKDLQGIEKGLHGHSGNRMQDKAEEPAGPLEVPGPKVMSLTAGKSRMEDRRTSGRLASHWATARPDISCRARRVGSVRKPRSIW